MNCDDFRRARLEGDDGPTGRRHLETCAACRARVPNLDSGRVMLADPAMWEEPSPELETQVRRLIGSDELRRPSRGWWRRWPVRTAAAVAVVLAGVGLYLALRAPAPDWEAVMPGTALAPDGFVYEFWLSKGRLHSSAGTFTAGGELELRSGVARSEFPRLWVTLEPLDEDESPTSHTVLDTRS